MAFAKTMIRLVVGDHDPVGHELEEGEVHGRLPDGAQTAGRPCGASKS